jgi:cytochrome P450
MPSGEQAWLVTGFADVRRGLSDPRLSNDQRKLKIRRPFEDLPAGAEPAVTTDLLQVDDPAHSRLRALVSESFTVQKAEGFRGRLEEISAELLDGFAADTSIDVVADFAVPFTTKATAELLGIPAELEQPFRDWGYQIAATILKKHGDELTRPVMDLHGFVEELVEYKRARPADDLLTLLAGEEVRMSPDERTSMIHLLLIAGQEGPVNLISTGTYLLLANPEQLAQLRGNPELLPGAVEEFLRYEAPLGLGIYRSSAEPVTFSGVTVPPGEPILFSLLSSGRDARRFTEPEQIDIVRGDHAHLGFGWGRHYCLGAPLGRVEAQVAIGSLIARFPELRFAVPSEEITWRPNVITRGLATLPVELTETRYPDGFGNAN